MKKFINVNLTNWTSGLPMYPLKNYSRIDSKIYTTTKKIFNYLLQNQHAIAVSIWSYLVLEVGVRLLPLYLQMQLNLVLNRVKSNFVTIGITVTKAIRNLLLLQNLYVMCPIQLITLFLQ